MVNGNLDGVGFFKIRFKTMINCGERITNIVQLKMSPEHSNAEYRLF